MLKIRDMLKTDYNALRSEYEGYIQMSDSRISHVFTTPSKLPLWEELHNEINYILEIALYEPKTKKSILIRQQNDKWPVLEKDLTGNEPTDSFFTLTPNTPKMKIAQIWEPKENEFCKKWDVLEPKYLLFAGFEA